MGEDRTPPKRRVTVAEAARLLDTTGEAVRSRIKRGTLESVKDGRTVYVLLAADQMPPELQPDADQTTDQTRPDLREELLDELRDRVHYLERQVEEERRARFRADELLARLMERIPELEAPQEPPGASETAAAEPERAEPRSSAAGAQEDTESPQRRSSWLEPVDKLPWWHYVLGLVLVGLASYVSLVVAWMMAGGVWNVIFLVLSLTLLNVVSWSVPGVFGGWVGFRRTNPHRTNPHLRSQTISFGVLVGLADALGRVVAYVWLDRGALTVDSYFGGLVFGGVLLGWLFYVSGALIGSAWQRRRTRHISATTPASPESRTDWTPRQQAILGFAGTVIAALIGLLQSVIVPIVASAVSGG